MIYIGLPQWSHPKWVRLGITSLEEYARHFNCVEGNTTLYALPKPEVVLRWREQTTDDFRFCFKFPATISHQAAPVGRMWQAVAASIVQCAEPTVTCGSKIQSLNHRNAVMLPDAK